MPAGSRPAPAARAAGDPAAGGAAAHERQATGHRSGRRPGTLAYTYEVGQNAQFIPEGAGIELKAGGSIYFNSTHQHSIGKEVKMHVRIGFKHFVWQCQQRWNRDRL